MVGMLKHDSNNVYTLKRARTLIFGRDPLGQKVQGLTHDLTDNCLHVTLGGTSNMNPFLDNACISVSTSCTEL